MEERRGAFARFRSRIEVPPLRGSVHDQLHESAGEFRFILIKRRSLGQDGRAATDIARADLQSFGKRSPLRFESDGACDEFDFGSAGKSFGERCRFKAKELLERDVGNFWKIFWCTKSISAWNFVILEDSLMRKLAYGLKLIIELAGNSVKIQIKKRTEIFVRSFFNLQQ